MEHEKRVVIIGGGLAGLCSGIYLRMNGYAVQILEAQDSPGGLCTAWSRKGYTFDGCIHWLLGSGPGTSMYEIWQELIDLNAVQFVHHDHVQDLDVGIPDARGDTFFHLYADLERQERYLLEAAPEDAREIRRWIGTARKLLPANLPPVLPPPEGRTWRDAFAIVKLLPRLPLLLRWGALTPQQYGARLKSPFLRRALEKMYGDRNATLLILLFQQAWYHLRCSGFPLGGSLAFARRFEERFRALGGSIRYRARVESVLVENDVAVGVRLADGSEERADVVVSAADGYWTHYSALGGRFLRPEVEALYAEKTMPPYPSLVYVSLGIRKRLGLACHMTRYWLPEPWVLPDGTRITQVPIHAYDYDPSLAPANSTAVTVMLESGEFEYWRGLRAGNPARYAEAKKEVAEKVIDLLEQRVGGVREAVEVVDVATPATFHRYTSNWKGSYEGWMPLGNMLTLPRIAREAPGLKSFHMVGQWVEPGGGLPPCALHGRALAQMLCARDGKAFRVVPPG